MFRAAILVCFQLQPNDWSEENLGEELVSQLLVNHIPRTLTAATMINAKFALAVLLQWAETVR